MRTAVDTSVLLDVLAADPVHGPGSREALRAAYDAGALLASDIVFAEVRAQFPADQPFEEMMRILGVRFDAMTADSAMDAGRRWAEYPSSGGPRDRVIADFLVGAHAARQADRLLTRDRGFYRAAFSDLAVIEPAHSVR